MCHENAVVVIVAMFVSAERVSTTSALYQLNYGVLCDIIIFKPAFKKGEKKAEEGPAFGGQVDYYYELPTDWALDQNQFTNPEHMWVLIMKDHKTRYSGPSMLSFICKLIKRCLTWLVGGVTHGISQTK